MTINRWKTNNSQPMKFYCHKYNLERSILIAADEDSEEKLKSLDKDTLIECKTSKNRNVKNHKRFFSFISTAFDMQSHFEDREEFRKWLTMKAGYYTTIVAPNGHTIFLPQSIAFASEIDEEEFKQLFKRCVAVMIQEFSVSMTEDQFWELANYD